MHQLKAALAAAAARREQAWSNEVRRALSILGQAARQEAENAAQPDSCCLILPAPSHGCASGCAGCGFSAGSCRMPSQRSKTNWAPRRGQAVDFTDIRQRLAWVLAGLRRQQARESDLIYEAYYDAFRSDPGTPLTRWTTTTGGPGTSHKTWPPREQAPGQAHKRSRPRQ